MKNPMSKLAVAAAVIVAVVIGVHQFAGSVPTFAEVVRPLLAARTATFTIDTDMKDQPPASVQGMFAEPGRVRMTIKMKVGDKETEQIQIMDSQQGKMLGLSPDSKMAVLLDIQNEPPETKQSQVNMFEEIRKRIRQAQQNVDESVKYLGSQQVDGVAAIGYRVSQSGTAFTFTVWANAETLLPVRIEYSMGEILGQEGTVVMKNFAFDVPLDEKLFSLEVPEGYQVQTMQIDASQPTENDLIETLRLWTETTSGKFPSALNMKTMFEEFGKAYGQKNQVDFKKNLEPSDPRFKQFMDAFAKVSRGIQFVLTLPAGSDWQYMGKDATFGDAKTAILWYRPKDSPTYRVIYADLKVADVARENLPK
jgi:outer membrane lipoprotein-sorting protein